MMSKPKNQFIDPAKAEDRNVFCGSCAGPVKGHVSSCPHCSAKFFANMHGYARLCKNPNCMRTEMAGHAHGLCKMHHQNRRAKQAASAIQRNCRCGNKASFGEIDCSRCRRLAEARFSE